MTADYGKCDMIEVNSLTKDFRVYERRAGVVGGFISLWKGRQRIVRAIDDLSFTIHSGAKVAYLGANGAGKSTTIKILTGIMTPTRGQCRVDNRIPYRDRMANARNIGVVFGQRTQLWWDLPVAESFAILKRIYEVPQPVFDKNMRLFAELLDIDALGRMPVRNLSLGQRMRVEVAASFLHEPKVVFLDEPTIGLDATLKAAIRTLINRVNHELGTTIVLASHDVNDIKEICDDAIILHRSRIFFEGRLADLFRTVATRTFVIDYRGPECSETMLRSLRAALPALIALRRSRPNQLTLEVHRDQLDVRATLRALFDTIDVSDVYASEPDIESILKWIYASQEESTLA